MTQGGGGGFETGADFVAAKVSVDIDTQSIQSLKQLSEGINNFRTTTEAAARGSSSFTGMLQQMTQAANMSAEAIRQLGAMQERTADFSQRMQTGGAGGAAQLPLSRNAPQGFVDNFAGMGVGMGMGGARTSSSDVAQQLQQQAIDPTRQNDPRKYLSAQAGRSRLLPGELTTVSPGETDWGSHADRVEARDRHQRDQEDATGRPRQAGPMNWQGQAGKYQGLANNMMNEMAPGRGFGGMANMAASGLGALASRFGGGAAAAGEEGGAAAAAAGPSGVSGMLGGLLKFLPGLGGIIGAAVGGLALVEKGGSMIQGMKNVGMVQGGGAGQGFGDEMRIRAMALDPFLTTEQARQVVMAGLTEGYKGNSFDVVTKFLASNLKDMNLAQPISAKVLTPTGLAKMGELAVGDEVIAGDGTPTRIVKISERGVNEVFEVRFADDTSTRCTMDHLWLVYQTNEKTPRVKFLRELTSVRRKNSSGLLRANGWPRYYVPLVQPVQFEQQDVPIDPYTLGILLGDGAFKYDHVSVTCAEEQFYDLTLPEGMVIRKTVGIEYRLTGDWNRWNRNPLRVALEGLGLQGVSTHAKFVPEVYLHSSVQQRFSLLQGLVDTDGHIDKNGIVFFTNASRQLIDDVKSLVLSLGGSVTIREVQPHQAVMKSGHVINSGLVYRMQLRLPGHLGAPCRLARKAKRYVPRMATDRKRTKAIISVTRVQDEECRCIRVAHPDQLYVTDDFTVTHNSVGDSVQLLRKNVSEGGESIGDLSKQLHGLKDLAKTGTTSLPDLQKNFAATSGALAGAGVSGKVAGDIATGAAGWFNTEATRGLKGQGSSMVQSLISGPEAGVGLEAFGGVKAPGVLPNEIVQFLSAQPGGQQKVLDAVKKELVTLVHMYVRGNPQKGSREYLNGVSLLMNALRTFMPGTQLDQAQVSLLVDNVLAGNDPTTGAKSEAAAPSGGGGPAPGAGGGAAPGAGGGAAAGGGGGPVPRGGTFTTPAGTSSAAPSGVGLTSAMVGQYGGGVQVIDAKGNSTPYTGSKAQQTGLSDGALKWARAGGQGGGLSLGQTTAGWGGSNKSGAETKVSFAPAIITVHVNTQTGKATVSPNVVQLTPNAQAVNAGVGSGTLNNPPPGDGYGGYTYAGGTGTGVRE